MRSLFLLTAILLLGFYSCKKDSPDTPQTIGTISDYTKLTLGNYWVYETYSTDTNGNETFFGSDSSYINGDTTINGETFTDLHFWQLFLPNAYYRDSSGFLVNSYHQIDLSTAISNDTFNTFIDPGFRKVFKTVDDNMPSFQVPAGVLDSILDVTRIVYLLAPNDTTYNPRVFHIYFAKGVGKIYEEYGYASNPFTLYKRKLVRFHVN